ncbi:MAG: S-layer homology domain-containing protein [Clostridia bacterium]|nr:S-layer homology domain-containing protein [Clostridia bacterium]
MNRKISGKNIASIFMTLIMVLNIFPVGVFAADEVLKGKGSAENPYLIENADQLIAFRELVNDIDSSTACAKLTQDIDLDNKEWTPFSSKSGYATTAYAGTFDGDFHKISGLAINSTLSYQGLFGIINGAVIKNLTVEGDVASSNNYIGGIVGKIQQGTVENCGFSGSVTTTRNGGYAGGIAGYAGNGATQTAVIKGCVNNADVTGATKGTVGGIMGYAKYTDITDCYNTGSIKGASRAGGIAGQLQNNCTAKNCYNIGSAEGGSTAADICDFLYDSASLANCYYNTKSYGAGGGTLYSDCGKITTSEKLLENLGNAFAEDSKNINNGYPVLLWQVSSAVVEKDPHISISGKNKLYMTNSGQIPQTTLTVQYTDMDNTPEIVWSVKNNSDIIKLSAPENADSSNKIVVVTAHNPGKATVIAKTDDGLYSDEFEISVMPYITTVETDGITAVGKKVYAKVNTLGGKEYDYENYPELTFQWKYLTNEDYTNGNTGSGTYKTISGAVNRELEITEDLENCYLSFVILFNGECKTPSSPVKVLSAAQGILTEDKSVLDIDTDDIKNVKTISLPKNGKNGSEITWESSNETVINPETGIVTLPESGICEITLTAALSYNGLSDTKEFKIMVYSQQELDEEKNNKLLRVKAAAQALGEDYKLYPVFGTDTNVMDIIKADLNKQEYSDIDVSIKEIEEVYGGAGIANDGTITYFYADPNSISDIKNGSCNVTFNLALDDAVYDFTVPVIIYWDVEKVKEIMTEEILDKVSLNNETVENIILPKVIDDKKWTQISWTSSDEDVICVSDENQQTADRLFEPYVGVVKRGAENETVTLTATFTFMLTNDVTGKESPITLNKVFEVTVGALDKEQLKKIQNDLAEKLENGFSEAGIKDAVTGETLSLENGKYTAYNDIIFPTAKDFGIDGKYYPITISSSGTSIKEPDVSNAARVEIYRPAVGKPDAEAEVTVFISDKNTNVTVSKSISFVVPALTQEEIDSEKALMTNVKASYFDGIKGENTDADNIGKNLDPFTEVYEENGKLIWVRTNTEKVNHGIVPVLMKGWEELEAWRLFKSSNPAVISHENLLVTMQNNAKAVTISSALSSETLGKYGELYLSDPDAYADYADLADLYYQEVSQELIVRGNSTAATEKPDAVSETINVSFKLKSSSKTLLSVKYTGLDETTNVYDLFERVLSENGCTFKSKGSYVYSITFSDGSTLSEFDEGPYSGWMYRVNGEIPEVVMGACGLKDGDEAEVFFVSDYNTLFNPPESNGSSSSSSLGGNKNNNTEGQKTEQEQTQQENTTQETADEVKEYNDTAEHWAEEYIVGVTKLGLMNGIGDDEFAPDNTLTRAMFVTILYRLEKEPEAKTADFYDVEGGSWYEKSVAWAYSKGIVNGVSGNEFAPNASITREQIAAMIYRYAEYKGMVDENTDLSKTKYDDNDSISDWALKAVAFCNNADIMIGNDSNEFKPMDNATRAEAAKILMILYEMVIE